MLAVLSFILNNTPGHTSQWACATAQSSTAKKVKKSWRMQTFLFTAMQVIAVVPGVAAYNHQDVCWRATGKELSLK